MASDCQEKKDYLLTYVKQVWNSQTWLRNSPSNSIKTWSKCLKLQMQNTGEGSSIYECTRKPTHQRDLWSWLLLTKQMNSMNQGFSIPSLPLMMTMKH